MSQIWIHHYPQYGVQLACCTLDLRSPVVYGDLSADDHILRRMRLGVFNAFENVHLHSSVRPSEAPGRPVVDTIDGILGRDR